MSYLIRPASLFDLDAVFSVERAAFSQPQTRVDLAYYLRQRTYLTKFGRGENWVFCVPPKVSSKTDKSVSETCTRIVGFISAELKGQSCSRKHRTVTKCCAASKNSKKVVRLRYHMINSIAVLPEFQKGAVPDLPPIGSTLMHFLLKRVKNLEPERRLIEGDRKSLRQVRLETNEKWEKVVKWYNEKFGFIDTGLKWKKYYWNRDTRAYSSAIRMEIDIDMSEH